nr:hypothetical protein [Actinomycetota bacterium]
GLTGVVEVVAGNGSDDAAGRPGPAGEASLGSAIGGRSTFGVGANGDVFTVSGGAIVLLVHDGAISELYFGGDGEFAFGGVAVGPDGAAYVTMSTGVKRITADGSSELLVDAVALGLGDQFGSIAFDGVGNLYFVAEDTGRVIRRGVDGSLSHVAGAEGSAVSGGPPVGDGGPAIAAPLNAPVALAVDRDGNLLIADTGQSVVRSVAPDGTISTIAGGGDVPMFDNGFAPDGTAATDLQIGVLTGVAVDDAGRVYVADGNHHAIVRFEPGGGIELVVADQAGVVEANGRPANQTRVRNVGGLGFDAAGDLYFYDSNVIRRIVGAAG